MARQGDVSELGRLIPAMKNPCMADENFIGDPVHAAAPQGSDLATGAGRLFAFMNELGRIDGKQACMRALVRH